MTLVWRPGYITTFADPDVQSYLTAVEEADGQSLEYPVAVAIDEFVRGCKNDGIWDAIKASCILAGARTLSGALVPLVGTAPTNFNFVDGDYNRETGLKGNGVHKYLDSNRNNNADPQNNNHNASYATSTHNVSGSMLIGAGGAGAGSNNVASDFVRNRSGFTFYGTFASAGLVGASRSASNILAVRHSGTTFANASSSITPSTDTLWIFRRNGGGAFVSSARIAFYSIGESLDLAALDTRVSDLITAIGAAIP